MSLPNVYKSYVKTNNGIITNYKSVVNGTGNYKTLLHKTFLPDEYESCLYLETNGACSNTRGQLINTGYVAGANMIFNLTADMTDGATGTSIGVDSKTIFAVHYKGPHETPQMKLLYNESAYQNPITDTSWTGKHMYTIDYYHSRAGCDGNFVAIPTVTRYSNTLPFIMGAWNEGNTYYYRATGKFYQLRITTGTHQQLNIIPALRKADKKPGMYDLVTKKFLTNSGTGEFGYALKDGTYVAPIL